MYIYTYGQKQLHSPNCIQIVQLNQAHRHTLIIDEQVNQFKSYLNTHTHTDHFCGYFLAIKKLFLLHFSKIKL